MANISSFEGFESSTGLNPITVEVIGSAFESTVDEMGEALVRASYSTNIKERRDCSTAIFDAQGAVLCQAEHIPIHLGSFLGFVPLLLERYKLEDIRPGDAFIGNDAYEGGGTHLPDIVLAEPVYHDGKLVAWVINTAHHSDFADRGHAHIYQEGLRIPPIKLYREGVLQKDVQDLILINCQVPPERLSDLRAQMASNRVGVMRVQALCEKYGADVVVQAGQELQDYAERKMRAGIREIPDGVYRFTDFFDDQSIAENMELSVRITVRGDEMDLHFDSPPQVRAGLNVVYTCLLSAVYYGVKTVVDPNIPPNAGLARPLTVTAEEGTLLNCIHPAAVSGRLSAAQRVIDLIHGALAEVVPEKIAAASNGSCYGISFTGQRPDRSLWVYLETIGGGFGARFNKDGLDGVHVHLTNTSNLPVEALEGEYPITVLRYELVDGSGGEGTYRGGMGLRRVYRTQDGCRVSAGGSRMVSEPWGLQGGLPGARGYCRLLPVSGEPVDRVSGQVAPGDVIEVVTAGSGGFGAPVGRDKDQVRQDIRDEVLTAERAREIYRVTV